MRRQRPKGPWPLLAAILLAALFTLGGLADCVSIKPFNTWDGGLTVLTIESSALGGRLDLLRAERR